MASSFSSKRAALEIALCYALILATLWTPRPVRTYLGLAAIVFLSALLLYGDLNGFGLGLKGLRESLWALGLTLLTVSIVFLCAAYLGTLHYRHLLSPRLPLSGYLVWSFIQQFVLQNLFFVRLLKVLRPTMAICVGGLLLSVAHLPNPLLVVATLFWGVGACWLFFYYRNLYVVAVIHFLFGVSLAMCIPSSVMPNMRVGWGYSHFRQLSRSAPTLPDSSISSAPRSVLHDNALTNNAARQSTRLLP